MSKICYLPADMDAPGFYRCLSPGRQLRDHGYDVFMPPRKIVEDPIGHKWGPHPSGPYVDGAECLECGLVATNAQIARTSLGGHGVCKKRKRTSFDMNFDLPRSADLYVLQQWRERVVAEVGIRKLRQFGAATSMDVDDNYVNIPTYSPAFVGTHEYRKTDGTILNRQARRNIKMPQGRSPVSTQARMLHGLKSHAPAPPNSANRLHMLESMRQVDLVTVSTPFLAEVYSPYHKNIEVIRNYVDWDMWDDIQPQYDVQRERVRIGYLARFSYRRDDLEVIRNVLPRFLKDHPEVDFVANEVEMHDFLGVPEEQRVTIGTYDFYDIETGEYAMAEMTATCDIGLVPLAMNDLNQGKSHLKGMEYNAAGIPFIASPTESYEYWMEQGKAGNGFLAYTEDDWYYVMELLVENHDLRKHSGRSGRDTARRHSIQQNWRAWDDVYSKLIGDECYASARGAIKRGAVQKVSELGPFLQDVRELYPKTVVEIGTARGGTFWAMAQHAAPDAHLISMDIPAGSPLDVRGGKDVYTGRDRDRIKTFKLPGQKLSLIDIDSQTQGALVALMQALGGETIDLLFIDGDHRYEGVKHDFETYSQLMSPECIVAFHDIVTHEDKRVGVERLWNEAKLDKRFKRFREYAGGETWGYTPWGGIGVLYGFRD